MLNRRGLLRMFGGGLAAGVVADPKDIAAEMTSIGGHGTLTGPEPDAPSYGSIDPDWQAADRLVSSVYEHREARMRSLDYIPPHIASKKSWSAAFKHSEAEKLYLAESRLIRAIEKDQKAARKVATALGLV